MLHPRTGDLVQFFPEISMFRPQLVPRKTTGIVTKAKGNYAEITWSTGIFEKDVHRRDIKVVRS